MFFTYKNWAKFCEKLSQQGYISKPARDLAQNESSFLVLKHDIENNVSKAYRMAKIEHRYGHRGSYYVQAYLLENKKNIGTLKKIEEMGHEVSYHYDVMDSNAGDIDAAIKEFETKINLFEKNGFKIKTVCQHGNPVIERKGYTSNRDFFRSKLVKSKYPNISDIMVDFKDDYKVDYQYYSDAGRQFKMIYDPFFNDVINSDEKNRIVKDLDAMLDEVKKHNCIISTHPHRWETSAIKAWTKGVLFKIIKKTAKAMLHVPLFKKLMNKYYYLAKKI